MPRKAAPCSGPSSTPIPRKAAIPSGIRPSAQTLSINGRDLSATITSNPLWRTASAAASPAGPPPITKTSVSEGTGREFTSAPRLFSGKFPDPLPTANHASQVPMPDAHDWSESYGFDDALRDTERFGPEAAAGPVHQLHNLFERGHKPIDLRVVDHERRRNFQHHEIVAANLAQNSMVSKQSHDHNLSKYCRMYLCECFEGQSPRERTGGLKFYCVEQAKTANLAYHFILR